MLVRVRFAKINGEKVSVQGNFAIFAVSNGFKLIKIFDYIYSGVKVLFLRLFFLSWVTTYSMFEREFFSSLVFRWVLYANKQTKKR